MLTGQELGKAIEEAIRKKNVKKADVARAFNVRPQSVNDWVKHGRVAKQHLMNLVEYFSDVVEPSHFGLDNVVIHQNHSGNGDNVGVKNQYSVNLANHQAHHIMPDQSLAPSIPSGSEIWIDESQTNIVDGKIYLVEYGGVKRYRRLFMLPESSEIALNSDNPLFPNDKVATNKIRIIGRVTAWKIND